MRPAQPLVPPRRAFVACVALLCALALAGSPALAADQPPGSSIDPRLAEILAASPSAQQINETSILLAPGAVMTVPGDVEPGATFAVPAEDGGELQLPAASSACTYQYICLWDGTYRSGARLMLYYCSDQYLSSYPIRPGDDWRDNASSIWNNQSGGVVSRFYDWKYLGYRHIGSLSAGNYLQDLSRDPAIGGGNLNNRIDMVRPC